MKYALSLSVISVVAGALACGCEGGTPKPNPGSGQVEMMSWWVTHGSSEGLAALVTKFEAENPGITVKNSAIMGGGGTVARTVVQMRIAAGDPPDLFQIHAGYEVMSPYVWPTMGNTMPQTSLDTVDDIAANEGWDANIYPDVLAKVTYAGHRWAVPVNIQKTNMLYYNIKVFSDNGLTPPKTFADFTTVAAALQQKGITPLALGATKPFTVTMLFEDQLAALGGPQYYKDFFDGKHSPSDMQVSQALTNVATMLGYVNSDAGGLTWDQAADKLASGNAAMMSPTAKIWMSNRGAG